jgi:hypothetical protein
MVDSLPRHIGVLGEPIELELYHLPTDPRCERNVLASHTDVARRLQAELVVFLREAGLRKDHLPYFTDAGSAIGPFTP